MENAENNVARYDGWLNLFSGLGTKADKTKSTLAVPSGFLSDAERNNIC